MLIPSFRCGISKGKNKLHEDLYALLFTDVVRLVTYLPFYRIHEIELYFKKNVEILEPKSAIVYIDNIYNNMQKKLLEKFRESFGDVEFKVGNWRNRNNTWLNILRDSWEYNQETVVVDSDNVIDSIFLDIHRELGTASIYTVLDIDAWERSPQQFLRRSRFFTKIAGKDVYLYRVFEPRQTFRGGSLFFIGPKQVVVFTKVPEVEILNKLERALDRVHIWLRNFISDETLLGIVAYLMGIKEVPWVVASRHFHHGSAPGKVNEALVASAHRQFAKGLIKEFGSYEFYLYYLKYTAALVWNLRNLF
jgi:hypothetical protein